MHKTLTQSRNYLAVIISLFILNACSSGPDSETLHKEVIAYHDVAMAKMGVLRKGQKEINTKLENSADSLSAETKEELVEKREKIAAADRNMMVWMRQFSENYDEDLPESEKVKILNDELVKVKKVDADIKEAVEIVQGL
ncbi:MAG: hypothetical protein WBA74_27320 [Cyclobacteriaceae bacterium]